MIPKPLEIKPTQDFVIVEPIKVANNKSDILAIVEKDGGNTVTAYVVALAEGKRVKGKVHEVEMSVKLGEKVLCPKDTGTKVKIEGRDCIIIKDADIIGVLSDE